MVARRFGVMTSIATVLLVCVSLFVTMSDAVSIINKMRRTRHRESAAIVAAARSEVSAPGKVEGPIQYGFECEVQFDENFEAKVAVPLSAAKRERFDKNAALLLLYRPPGITDRDWGGLSIHTRRQRATAFIRSDGTDGWLRWDKQPAPIVAANCAEHKATIDCGAMQTLWPVISDHLHKETSNQWTTEVQPAATTTDLGALKRAHDALVTLFGDVGIQIHTTFVLPPAAPTLGDVVVGAEAAAVAALFARANDYIGIYKYGRDETTDAKEGVAGTTGIVTSIENRWTGSVPQTVVTDLARRLTTGRFEKHVDPDAPERVLAASYRQFKYNFVGFRFGLYGEVNRYGFEIRGTPGLVDVDRYHMAASISAAVTSIIDTTRRVQFLRWPVLPLTTEGRTIGAETKTAEYGRWFRSQLIGKPELKCSDSPLFDAKVAEEEYIDRLTCGQIAEAMRARIEQCSFSGLSTLDLATPFNERLRALVKGTPRRLRVTNMVQLKKKLVVSACRELANAMQTLGGYKPAPPVESKRPRPLTLGGGSGSEPTTPTSDGRRGGGSPSPGSGGLSPMRGSIDGSRTVSPSGHPSPLRSPLPGMGMGIVPSLSLPVHHDSGSDHMAIRRASIDSTVSMASAPVSPVSRTGSPQPQPQPQHHGGGVGGPGFGAGGPGSTIRGSGGFMFPLSPVHHTRTGGDSEPVSPIGMTSNSQPPSPVGRGGSK